MINKNFYSIIILFAGEILAFNDLWLVGDDFLHDHYYKLPQIKNDAYLARERLPYMYDFYNVSCFTPNPQSLTTNVIARLVNSFIKALNDTNKIPRIVLIIPEDDLLTYLFKQNEEFGIGTITFKVLNWISTQMTRATDAKKDDLKRVKPGAVIPTEPKFIWVKMLNRVNARSDLLALRSKFNEVLEEVLYKKDQHYIIDIVTAMADSSFYDKNNYINGEGLKRFWIEIDKLIENFDTKRCSLKPVYHAKHFDTKNNDKRKNQRLDHKWIQNNKQDNRFRMPPPPPQWRGGQDRHQNQTKKRLDFDKY